ncbi:MULTISPECIES: hypothetical protein [unclassified Campylobacter]|nr:MULTISPECIES: hypothetical protein [unclassified Campylobacter]MDA3054179.1 hypothetical protein [Campylobacter sp. VBCF_07 NA4]MDA3060870.1 hypothetical protein [Campylobacter sp. VBCF_02 NA5]MDA3070383.1 hypothetical protein [Campylobacter sp. VBCF_08 NA3]WBR53692.1 hypothetical protein PF027_05010 [Campylobacter sp. VBCF_01 NA2]
MYKITLQEKMDLQSVFCAIYAKKESKFCAFYRAFFRRILAR